VSFFAHIDKTKLGENMSGRALATIPPTILPRGTAGA
jgi:hypothetical protein